MSRTAYLTLLFPMPAFFTITLISKILSRLTTGKGVVGWVLLLLLFPVTGEVKAQEGRSPVFPAERHRELMEELDFSLPDEKEPEEAEEVVEDNDESDGSDWFDWDWGDGDFSFTSGISIFIFVILLILLGLLVYRMLGDVSLRKRTRSEEDDTDRIDINDIEEEKLVAAGVSLSLLERAERAGQFDVAVRLMYIQLLKELQDAGLIKYRRDFSNRDYQNQLRGKDVLPDFRAVTAEYERYWFGKYPIDRLSYRNTYQRFQALNERIRTTNVNTNRHV